MGKPVSVRLVLVSSAATGWDAAGRLLGRASVNATDEALGSFHAEVRGGLIETLAGGPVDLVLSGTEDSVLATAAIVSEAAPCKSKSLDGLANVDLGLWQGALLEELEGRCPSIYRGWRDQPASIRPPQGESIGDAADRAIEAVRRAVEKSKNEHVRAVVVVRPMLWGAMLAVLGEESWSNYWRLVGENGRARALDRGIAELNPTRTTATA